jgi:hypothetical protein
MTDGNNVLLTDGAGRVAPLKGGGFGPHLEEFAAFLPALNRESDRGMALIATSFVDELLKRTLQAFHVDHPRSLKLVDGFGAPLGDMATRTTACFALGLISETEADEADRLRKIRNRFAHDIHVAFDDQKITAMCGNLVMAAQDYGDVVVGARGRFATSATGLILNLTNRPHYVSRQRRKFTAWPY